MTADHSFIDSAGNALAGKTVVLAAWEGFFSAFPDYRNEWASVDVDGETTVAVGRSLCASEPALDGPALWSARRRPAARGVARV